MARWRLMESAYLNVEGDRKAEWEYKEISRQNGREIKKKFSVPTLLDPKSADDWTHRESPFEDGIIVLSNGNNPHPKDIIYKGPLFPAMEPIDDEARELSAAYNKTIVQIDGRDDATYSERLLDKFIEQLADAQATATQQSGTKGFDDVLKSMTEMMAQNQKILATLVERDIKRKVA